MGGNPVRMRVVRRNEHGGDERRERVKRDQRQSEEFQYSAAHIFKLGALRQSCQETVALKQQRRVFTRLSPSKLDRIARQCFLSEMRRRSTRRQTGTRGALIAGAVALFFALQGLFAPFVAMNAHAAYAVDGASIGHVVDSALCQKGDAGDPSDHARHNHQGCCILCEASARDAAFVLVFAFVAAARAPRQDAGASGADYPEPRDTTAIPAGWASSWSSRAPPFFS